MTLGDALRQAVEFLTANDVGSPRMNAEVLLMHVLGVDRAYVYGHPEHQLTTEEQSRYHVALGNRASGVPSQYITGHQEFWGLDLIVTPAVLIPRPETEHAVETVIELVRGGSVAEEPRIVDVGTGSGCIVLALAKELPDADLHAVDVSPDALEIAETNAARLQLDHRISFHHSDLLEPFADNSFDMVVSNPPYVGESEADRVQREVKKFEPHVAVFGGGEGLDIYRLLAPQAARVLRPGGWLVMEIGFTQQPAIAELLDGWSEVRFVPDLQGIPRVAVARKSTP